MRGRHRTGNDGFGPQDNVVVGGRDGAFDLISREAMLQELSEVEGCGSVLPFVRLFYSSPSMYWWTDDAGGTHEVWQAENRATPLCPLCTLVDNTGPSSMSAKSCWIQNVRSRSWMMCTCVVALIVLRPFTRCWDGTQSMFGINSRGSVRPTVRCWSGSQQSKIFSRPGCCSCAGTRAS